MSTPSEVRQALADLGVAGANSLAETKKAFHRLAKQTHPDRNPDADPASFKRISAAWSTVQEWVHEGGTIPIPPGAPSGTRTAPRGAAPPPHPTRPRPAAGPFHPPPAPSRPTPRGNPGGRVPSVGAGPQVGGTGDPSGAGPDRVTIEQIEQLKARGFHVWVGPDGRLMASRAAQPELVVVHEPSTTNFGDFFRAAGEAISTLMTGDPTSMFGDLRKEGSPAARQVAPAGGTATLPQTEEVQASFRVSADELGRYSQSTDYGRRAGTMAGTLVVPGVPVRTGTFNVQMMNGLAFVDGVACRLIPG